MPLKQLDGRQAYVGIKLINVAGEKQSDVHGVAASGFTEMRLQSVAPRRRVRHFDVCKL